MLRRSAERRTDLAAGRPAAHDLDVTLAADGAPSPQARQDAATTATSVQHQGDLRHALAEARADLPAPVLLKHSQQPSS